MKGKQELGRIALRVEGEWWNAYWAPKKTTMDGAVLLATIRMSAVSGDRRLARKTQFVALVQGIFEDAVDDSIGEPLSWVEVKRAPERERSGSA